MHGFSTRFQAVWLLFIATAMFWVNAAGAAPARRTLSLNGTWEIAEGGTNTPPSSFVHRVPVPGLADMAEPAFERVGESDGPREAFWYRRFFTLSGAVPEVATLKIHKAAYGAQVFLNGHLLGEHAPSFTPGYFDARPFLRGYDATNELVVRVGAHKKFVPKGVADGSDFEKKRYIPGIYDEVELILSGTPHLLSVQTVPDIIGKLVRVQVIVRNSGPATKAHLQFVVKEAVSGMQAGAVQAGPFELKQNEERLIEVTVPTGRSRLWSPEDPFLYELVVGTGADSVTTRFGMREFHLDPATGQAFLNGRPYFLRGSNVTLYRFFEDALRGNHPWNEDWVRRLHRKFRSMHWNALRYCIGFPPEQWYRIADEEGFLIQDEFPLWGGSPNVDGLKRDELAREYAEWMKERWNHPCVVIWDAQNETVTEETGAAIQRVRGLDLSDRPWDNGWSKPQARGDSFESHPYLAINPNFRLEDMAGISGVPTGNPTPNTNHNPIVINEYGWMWLNRDGSPTTLTGNFYRNLLGGSATEADRRHVYARWLAAMTEFWRCHRACAGVLEFCGLGYSRPDGQTSDHFIDIDSLEFDAEFEIYVRDAFSPVGLMIDEWAAEMNAGGHRKVSVALINDLDQDWGGRVRFRLLNNAEVLEESEQMTVIRALGTNQAVFDYTVPARHGLYQLEASLIKPGAAPVRSLRDFEVLTEVQKQFRHGLAKGRAVKASSSATRDNKTYDAQYAVDGLRTTRWSSEFSDTQWLAINLGTKETISRVEIDWENAYAKKYAIEVSTDGASWIEVARVDEGKGGTEKLTFKPVEALWVRFHGIERATPYGYSFWEMRVFR